MTGPLQGLTVVDAGWGMPTSIASMLLADYGANVIAVGRPGADDDLGLDLSVLQRGKHRIQADPRTIEGRNVIRGLVESADIFIEAFGPGVASDWGLDGNTLRASNPRLITASVTGYGKDGPWKNTPGYSQLLAAKFGMTAEQRAHREDGPIFLGHPTVDYGTAFMTLIGVLAAVRARLHTGAGQDVDTSLLDGMLAISSMNWWWNERDISYLARSGSEKGFGRKRLITDPFECADGRYIIPHTGGPGTYKKLMDILGFGDQVQAVEGPEIAVPLNDTEYDIARRRLPEAFRRKTADEWLELFHAADIAALPVLRLNETFDDEQVRFADLATELSASDGTKITAIGPVIRYEQTPAEKPKTIASPVEAAEACDLLVEGKTSSGTERWRTEAASTSLNGALEGVRVVDFSSYFATSFGAKFLADHGAEVVKVEPVVGDQMRPLGDLFEAANRGKRSLAVDLRTAEGQEIARRLVANGDVVMQNFRPGKAEKIGLGYEQLREINPDLVYVYLPGFGSKGPKSGLKSFAPLLSGFTGLNYEGAGEGNGPIRRVIGNEDLYNGFLGAVATLMAILNREAGCGGQYVESPQLHSSLFVLSQHAADTTGELVSAHCLDATQSGCSPLPRIYRTTDGWIAIAVAGNRRFTQLGSALGSKELTEDPRFASEFDRRNNAEALESVLEKSFASMTTEEARERMRNYDVPAEVPLDFPLMPELLWEEWMIDSGRVIEHHHPEYGWCREVGIPVRLSATPARFRGPSPSLGRDTRDILAELGYTEDAINELTATVCAVPPTAVKENA